MDRSLFIAMSGSKENMLAQAVRSNNLANASTVGFRADMADQFSMPVYGDTFPTRVYAATRTPSTDFTPSSVSFTGNDLDVAINNEGFFAVETADGIESYTRRGDLKISETGQLINGAGHTMVGVGGPIEIPLSESITIAKDGTVRVVPLGAENAAEVAVGQIKLVNPPINTLQKNTYGTFSLADNAVAEQDFTIEVQSGAVENSNVNIVSELVELISLARQHELNVKMMRSTEDNENAMARIMQIA